MGNTMEGFFITGNDAQITTHAQKKKKKQHEMKGFSKKPARHAGIRVICTGSVERAAYVLLSRWPSVSGILYPFSMAHSLLMAHYVKYCALIMPKSTHDDPKYGIIHFASPVILRCRIRRDWIQRRGAITHLSISRLRVLRGNKTAIV